MRAARQDDRIEIERLLVAAELPTEGVADILDEAVVEERSGLLVGVAALERLGEVALLRSVVVAPRLRGSGVGRELVGERLAHAAGVGIRDVYLLTTTAESFFASLGFVTLDRADAPAAVRGSAEFASICPTSAAFMHRQTTATTTDRGATR